MTYFNIFILLFIGSCVERSHYDNGEKTNAADTTSISIGITTMKKDIVYLDTINFLSKFYSLNSNNDEIYLMNENGCVTEFIFLKKEILNTCTLISPVEGRILAYHEQGSFKAYSYGYDTDFHSIVLSETDTVVENELLITDMFDSKILYNDLEFIKPSARAITFDISSGKYDTLSFRGMAYFYSDDKYLIVQYDEKGNTILYTSNGDEKLNPLKKFNENIHFIGFNDNSDLVYLYSNSNIFMLDKMNHQKIIHSGSIISAVYNEKQDVIYGIEFDVDINKYKIFKIVLN